MQTLLPVGWCITVGLSRSCDHLISGAMENWGLITYRDRMLLVDPKETPEATKQLVAIVVGNQPLSFKFVVK